MQLLNTPRTASPYRPDSIAAKNTKSFAQKPAKGGIPAIENIDMATVNAINGFSRCNPESSSIYLMGPDAVPEAPGAFEVDNTIVQIFRLIII